MEISGKSEDNYVKSYIYCIRYQLCVTFPTVSRPISELISQLLYAVYKVQQKNLVSSSQLGLINRLICEERTQPLYQFLQHSSYLTEALSVVYSYFCMYLHSSSVGLSTRSFASHRLYSCRFFRSNSAFSTCPSVRVLSCLPYYRQRVPSVIFSFGFNRSFQY